MNLLQTHFSYAVILVISLLGLNLIDFQWKLLIWRDKPSRQAFVATLLCGLVFFVVWDIIGIVLGIFYTNTRFTLGINLISENLPLEEIGFLSLLIYVILILILSFERQTNKNVKKTINPVNKKIVKK